MSENPTRPGGRRVAARATGSRPDLTVVLAVVVPLLLAAALALTARTTAAPAEPSIAPDDAALTSLQLVCPKPLPRAAQVYAASADGAAGQVTVRSGDDSTDLELTKGVADAEAPNDALILSAVDDLAPGLLAARFGGAEVASAECVPPSPERWFTGVGAGADHTSKLQLVNPDSGPAVADVTVYGRDGLLPVANVRGITIEGGADQIVDLATVAPDRDDLTLRVSVSRGRIASSVIDTAGASSDWLPAQPEPLRTNVLLGLPKGAGDRNLVLTNPSANEARATVMVTGASSTFAPAGVEDIQVPPESTVVTDLSDALRKALAAGDAGLVVTSDTAVSATLRSVVGDDLSHAVSVSTFTDAGVLLPARGEKALVLAATETAGLAKVRALDAAGSELSSKDVEVKPRTSSTVKLPAKTAMVLVESTQGPLNGAVQLSVGKGTSVLPLRDLVRTSKVPDVRPSS